MSDKIEKLLKSAKDHIHAPHDFAQKVMHRLELIEDRKWKRRFFIRNILLALSLMWFFYAVTVLVIDLLTADTFGFFQIGVENPEMLVTYEWGMAFWEALPLSSFIFTFLSILFCLFTFYKAKVYWNELFTSSLSHETSRS